MMGHRFHGFRGERGSSMVGVLVAGGLVGGLALVLAELNTQQTVTQKKIETGVEVSALFQQIERTMQDADACRNTVLGGTIAPSPAPPPPTLPTVAPGTEITIGAIKSAANRDILVTGNTYGNRLVSITSQAVRINIAPFPTGGGDVRGALEVVMTRESRAYTGQKTVTKRVPLVLKVDNANKLTSCQYDETAQADSIRKRICEDIAKWPPSIPAPHPPSPWDPVTKRCNLGVCSANEIMKGFDSTGKACRVAIPDMRCNDPREVMVGIKLVGGVLVPECKRTADGSCLGRKYNDVKNALPEGTGLISANDFISSSPLITCDGQNEHESLECGRDIDEYREYTPLGCCYEGGKTIPTTGECALTDGTKALRVRYCRAGRPQPCPQSPLKSVNCTPCNEYYFRFPGSPSGVAWRCVGDLPQPPDSNLVNSRCLIPYYQVDPKGNRCVLAAETRDLRGAVGWLTSENNPYPPSSSYYPPITCDPKIVEDGRGDDTSPFYIAHPSPNPY